MAFLPYLIDSFRGGVSDENDKGIVGSFKHGHALNIHARNDTIVGKQAMVDITPTGMNGLVRQFVTASDGSTYAFSANGSVFAISGDWEWTFAYNDENGEIKGASEWGVDGGATYLFWGTDTSIARKQLIGNGVLPWTDATQDHKTVIDSGDHTMKAAAGVLSIANGNFLATIDYFDNFDPIALNIRPGNLIKSLEERDDSVIIGSKRKDVGEQGHVWSWIVTALNWIEKKKIPAKGVNAILTTEMMLLQSGADGELFTTDFVNAPSLHGVPGGGQVNPGGVTIEDDIALFGFYGGTYPGIWSYGRKRTNQPNALNYDYRLSPTVAGSTVTEVGAIKMVNGTLLASWETTDGSTVEYGIDSVSSTTKATYLYEGLEFSNGEPFNKRWHQQIKVTAEPMASGTSISAKYKLDNESVWRYAVMGSGSTTHTVSGGNHSTEAEFMINKPGMVYEVGVEGNPSLNTSPEITSITTYINKEKYEHG